MISVGLCELMSELNWTLIPRESMLLVLNNWIIIRPSNLSISKLRIVHLSYLFVDFSVWIHCVTPWKWNWSSFLWLHPLSCLQFSGNRNLPPEETKCTEHWWIRCFYIIAALVYGAFFPCKRALCECYF